jgi:carboxypeptidase C (cathepsin A)
MTVSRLLRVMFVGVAFIGPVSLPAQQRPQAAPAPGPTKAGQEAELLPAEPVVTQHTARIGGQSVAYTAEAGWLPIREDGKLTAKMFYIAYTRSGIQDQSNRPLIFSFNGGPGTASVWMHMGYTGPRRVTYDDDGFAQRPPIGLEDNPHSILDAADIVYIDPVATGFSRMVEGEDLHQYHGKQADIESVGQFIHLFLVRKDRWMSPKFVIGESYGTTRASGLAGHLLSRYQIYLNGVILVSMTRLDQQHGPDVTHATQLPHLAATAWYHRQLGADLQGRPLQALLDEVEDFALGDYLGTLVRGDRLTDADRSAMAERVARYTGLEPEYVRSANLRVDTRRFWKELLRDERLTVGRLDSRYLGVDRDAAGENPEYDPAIADWNGPFANAVNRYLREELRYSPELQYNVWGSVRPWRQDETMNVSELLREAMRNNPYLKVLIQGGYYDAATDYYSAVYTISHIQPGGEFRDRFRFAWYESGHMMYLRKPDLQKSNDDLRDFIRWALEGARDYPRRVGRPATTSSSARP